MTFVDPARDKQFRLSIALARGTEFLLISLSYSSSIAILIGSIIGYLVGAIVLGRLIMRSFEWAHQLHNDAPSVVTEYLASLAPPPAPLDEGHKATLKATGTLGHFDDAFDKDSVPIGSVEMDPQITRVSNYDANRLSTQF